MVADLFYDPNDLNHDAYSLYSQSNITLEANFDVDDFDIIEVRIRSLWYN
jgi:hypothetical protein